MKKIKEKTEEMPDGLKLTFKWILLVVGVPSIAGFFLYISSIYSFEIATTNWQIFLGFVFFVILLIYEVLIIKYLVDETIEYFK